MPYLETAQSWLTQSTLLLKARPSTVCLPFSRLAKPLEFPPYPYLTISQTLITTKYTISPPSSSKKFKSRKTKSSATSSSEPAAATPNTQPDAPRAALTLKTYDPVSGATLKYSTNKAAEVSRLIQILGRLARPMSGLPEVKEDVGMVAAGVEGEGSGAGTPAVESVPAVVGGGKPGQQAQGGGAGGKKKKKGKK
jgi:hypothetical protein